MCITTSDLLSLKINCQPVQVCCTDEDLQAAINRAINVAEIFTQRKLCPYEDCKLFSGNGKRSLFLVESTTDKLTEIESITDVVRDKEINLDLIINKGYWLESNYCFPCGKNNIRICGTWGEPIQEYLKYGIMLLALEIAQPGSAGLSNPGGVTRADWEDFSISYRVDETFNDLRPTTGYREIDNILVNFISPASQIGFSIVPSNENCFERICGKVVNNNCCGGDISCG